MANAPLVVVQVVIVIILAVLYALSHSKMLQAFSLYFPPASTMMVVGLILGAIFKGVDDIKDVFAFNPHIFFEVLLPPIIFHAGLTVPKKAFFRNFGTIFTMAFLGTLLAAIFIGSMVYACRDGTDLKGLSFTRAMIFGSLLSAVDPVSTIAVFRRANVGKGLYTIVFGESILNDAVAIVIFRVFTDMDKNSDKSAGGALGEGIGLIIGITLGSLFFGTFLALFAAKIFKHSSFKDYPPLELGFLVSIAYLSFIVAEEIHLSGIMSSLFCAICMDHYAMHNISTETLAAADSMFTMLADVAESFVFVYLGMACFTFDAHDFKVGLSLATLTWCVLSRAATTFGLGKLLNMGRKRKLDNSNLFIIFLSGLRGAVGFALAMDSEHENGPLFVTSTLVIVFITTIVFGGAAYPSLKALDLVDNDSLEMTKDETSKHWFVYWDQHVLVPTFRREKKNIDHDIAGRRISTYAHGNAEDAEIVRRNLGMLNQGGVDAMYSPDGESNAGRPDSSSSHAFDTNEEDRQLEDVAITGDEAMGGSSII